MRFPSTILLQKVKYKKLNDCVLKVAGYTGYILESAPEKVLQFGEGNFLRALVNCWFDIANEKASGKSPSSKTALCCKEGL